MNRKPRKTTIFRQFLMFVLPFVVLAVSATSAVLMWTNYRHFKNTIAQDYQNIIEASAGEIQLFMAFAFKNLETLAWVLAAEKPDPHTQKIALIAFNHVNSEFKHVSLVSPEGDVVTSTRWSEVDAFSLDNNLLQRAANGQNGFSDIRFTQEQFPYVVLAVPAPRFSPTPHIVWAELDLKYVWSVLEGISIGRSGHVYIMDVTGKYIAHRQIDQVLTTSPQLDADTLGQIRKAKAPVAWFEKKEHQTFYCLGFYVPDLKWIVTLRQPTKEIYYHLFQNLYWAGLIIAAACFSAIMFGWYRIKRFLNPIETMHLQVQEIGAGNLNKKVKVTTSDEIGELGTAFNDMTQALKEKIHNEIRSAQELAHAQDLAVLGISAGKVTHEVGNLLNNVGMAAHALGGETLSPRGESSLAKMEKESIRVKAFIQDFLKFAKPPELHLAPLSLDLILREVMAMHSKIAEERGIAFEMDWPSPSPQINADAQLIYQTFNNLIKNSTEAVKDDGCIRISASLNDDYLVVTIEDNGSGVAPENLERIFDPFFTTKGKKGTGLGMAIVKSTITAHRGTITCQSDGQNGTQFLIHLPLR